MRQCALLGVSRSSLYYRAKVTSQQDLSLMQELDRQYLETPFYGSRRMRDSLERQGMAVSRKRVQRLMRAMGLRAIYRQPRTSRPAPERRVLSLPAEEPGDHQAQPGMGGGHHLPAHGPGIPLPGGNHGLAQPVRSGLAIVQHSGGRLLCRGLDRGSRLGNARDVQHRPGKPVHQPGFTQKLQEHSVRISMDGRGRYQDNIFAERLWRTVKYEEVGAVCLQRMSHPLAGYFLICIRYKQTAP